MRGLLVALAMTSAADASPLIPPKRFDFPYPGPVDIRRVERDNVWAECSHGGQRTIRPDVAGCASVRDGVCIIHLATLTRRAKIEAILRHEIAHCNGWRH